MSTRWFPPALAAEEESAVEQAGYWLPWREFLVFAVRGKILWQVCFSAFTNVKPLTRIDGWIPPPKLPPGVRAATIPAQPVPPDITPGLQIKVGHLRYIPVVEDRPLIKLEGTIEQYLAKFSGKSRKNIRREVAAFRDFCGGELTVSILDRPDQMAEFQEIAAVISRKTYKASLGLTFDASVDMLTDLQRKAERGAVRGYVLSRGTHPVGYAFCRTQFEHLNYAHIAHDPEYDRWSPGKVLLFLMIESLLSEGKYRYLDLGGDAHWYKRFYANHSVRCARTLFVPLASSLSAIVLSHYVFTSLLRWGATALKRRRRVAGTAAAEKATSTQDDIVI